MIGITLKLSYELIVLINKIYRFSLISLISLIIEFLFMVIYILTYMKARTDVRTYGRTDVRTVADVMTIKPNFLASMGYQFFLGMVLRARGAPL